MLQNITQIMVEAGVLSMTDEEVLSLEGGDFFAGNMRARVGVLDLVPAIEGDPLIREALLVLGQVCQEEGHWVAGEDEDIESLDNILLICRTDESCYNEDELSKLFKEAYRVVYEHAASQC